MTQPVLVALWALGLFQLKHFICDFALQTERHARLKGIYGHPAGLEHAGIHVAGTIPCLWLVGATPLAIGLIAAAEFVIHYHVDWLKEQIVQGAGWTTAHKGFWVAIGVDQLVHHATYLAIVFVLMTWAGAIG